MTHISELDTPALIIDLDAMERNLKRVADYTRAHGLRLRPHTKTHKIPELGRRQVALGAVGLTVAKTTEAEVMLRAGPSEMLVAFPVLGRQKTERLMKVASQTPVTVAVDNAESAKALSLAAEAAGVSIGVLAEFDAGLHRVGAETPETLVGLVREISRLPGLRFLGLNFYPGHIKDLGEDLTDTLQGLDQCVSSRAEAVEKAGFSLPVISGGSTPTLFESHRIGRVNEIRPGTYIFNDRNTWQLGACELSDCAASIIATVVSTSIPGQVIIDGGSKTFSSDRCAAENAPGYGYFPDAPQAVLTKMNEEHGYVDVRETGGNWRPGDRLRVIPNHICVAMNLHEKVYGIRGDEVVEEWKVEGRGKLQ